tara:strand:- start:48 stop:263 length:216 start_codon:yes stop_codon:yes gene_type:complete
MPDLAAGLNNKIVAKARVPVENEKSAATDPDPISKPNCPLILDCNATIEPATMLRIKAPRYRRSEPLRYVI